MKKKALSILLSIVALVLGLAGGAFGFTYVTIPDTEVLTASEEVYYSYNDAALTDGQLTGAVGELSVHFLELGNKYTGDCTYIKYKGADKDYDILIDCGSKASSIPTVTSYLNNYVTDGVLEFVIVTHAHLDHYAGFATSGKTKGIFDLYKCEKIIDFGGNNETDNNKKGTNQTTGVTYQNYLSKRQNEIDNDGATYYPAQLTTLGNNKEFVIDNGSTTGSEFKFEVLYNFYYDHKAATENDYSVCTLFSHNNKKFLFTGDLEKSGEDMLVQNNQVLKDGFDNGTLQVDLYKAGHHGSKTSSNENLLKAIQPKLVCICCCAGSSEYSSNPLNQFPTQDFINRISKYTTNIYVTTLCIDYKNNEFTSMNGNIMVISVITKSEVSLAFSNNSTKLKDTNWFKANRTWPEN